MQKEKRLIPQLRFPEFEGEWKKKKLENRCSFFSGGTPTSTKKDFYIGEIPFIGSGNIFDKQVDKFISDEALKNSSAKIVEEGDILYALYGANSGDVAISQLSGAINQAVLCIRTKEKRKFLYQILTHKRESIVRTYLQGGQGNLSAKIVKKIKIAFPENQEQQKIADLLSAVDNRIQNLEKKKALLEQYKKGVMQQLFKQEIRFKDDEGNAFPEWETRKLGDLLTIGSGKDYKHLDYGTIPVFGSGGLMTNVNDFLYDGDSVGIGRKGTIDKPVFLTGKFWTVDTLFYTHTFKNVIPRFILYTFLKINWYKYNEASGVPSLSKRTIEIGVTSIKEQTKIANFLSAIDQKTDLVDQQIEHAKTYKKGLLQQMFV